MNLLLVNPFKTITEKFRNTHFWNILCSLDYISRITNVFNFIGLIWKIIVKSFTMNELVRELQGHNALP